jgi:AcrR family transcriptional regulator
MAPTTEGGDPGEVPVPVPRSEDARVVRTRNDVLRAALDVLIDQGRDAVTHPNLARVSGYSRATLYNHWPTRAHLVRDAFSQMDRAHHHTPTGDLRADLIGELTMFRLGMQRRRLDRALAVLADLAASTPELAELRDELVVEGERVLRQLLGTVLRGDELEAAALMLSGAVLDSALMHGRLPADEVIAAAVDLVLRAAGAPPA